MSRYVYCLLYVDLPGQRASRDWQGPEIAEIHETRTSAEKRRAELLTDIHIANPFAQAGSYERAASRDEEAILEWLTHHGLRRPRLLPDGCALEWTNDYWWRSIRWQLTASGLLKDFLLLLDRACPYRIVPVELEA